MKLPKDNLFCRIKKMIICMVIVLGTAVFAEPPIYVPSQEPPKETTGARIARPYEETTGARIARPYEETTGAHIAHTYKRTPFSDMKKVYTENEKKLLRYYDEQVKKYGKIDNNYEDNYMHMDGRHFPSNYQGVLAHVLIDFDCDQKTELAIFRIETINNDDDITLMNIILDIVKDGGGQELNVSSKTVLSENFDGDSLECDIGIKKVNDRYRIYVNYFSMKEIERDYINKYVVLDYSEEICELNNIDLSGNDDIQEYKFEYQDEVIDSGLNLYNDNDIYKKAFIFDDIEMMPVFVIKRVNEKIRTGFTEEYIMQHENELRNELEKEYDIKIRYGYTILVDRTKD